MAEAVKESVAGSTCDLDFLRLAPEPFVRVPKKSIDYAKIADISHERALWRRLLRAHLSA
jgi:mannose-1-phosphate guanylyltransferase